MPDPHKRHTAQNIRGGNDFLTKREAYAGTQRMLDRERKATIDAVTVLVLDTMAAHVARYHTPWYVRAWRRIARRGQ